MDIDQLRLDKQRRTGHQYRICACGKLRNAESSMCGECWRKQQPLRPPLPLCKAGCGQLVKAYGWAPTQYCSRECYWQWRRGEVARLNKWEEGGGVPTAAMKPCSGRCGRLVGSGRCEQCTSRFGPHGWSAEARKDDAKRLRGRALQAARAALFAREPLCRMCSSGSWRDSRGTGGALATVRDHIIPLGEGGEEDESNVQPLCAECNIRKTASEAQRGRRRGRDIKC